MARSISRSIVDAQRIQDALTTNNIGLENNVPQGGVVWVFAVKK